MEKNKMTNIWESIYEVGGLTGDEYLLLFIVVVFSTIFLRLKKRNIKFSSSTKIVFIIFISILIGVVLNGRWQSFELKNILKSGENVIILEGELSKALNITTYDPYIGEKLIIADVNLFRPDPTRHSTKVGCWSRYISDSWTIKKGDTLRIHYIWLYKAGPEMMIDGKRQPLDIPCILKVERRRSQ